MSIEKTGVRTRGQEDLPPAAPTAGQAETFMQDIYGRIDAKRQVASQEYLSLIMELNDNNNKAEMLKLFAEAIASYDGEPEDFEQEVLVPFREEHPGFDDAFDVSPFQTEDGYDLRVMGERVREAHTSLNNANSQKQLDINQAGMARDQYIAFISKFVQDLHRLLERLIS